MTECQIDINVLERLKNKYKIYADNSGETSTQKVFTSLGVCEVNATTADYDVTKNPSVNKKQKLKPSKKIQVENTDDIVKDNAKPLMTVVLIDPDVVSEDGTSITNALEAIQIQYTIQPQIVPNTITWMHADPTSTTEASENEEINEVIIIMHWNEILNLIETRSLIDHIKSLQEIMPKKRMYLGMFGFENYFKFWKLKKINSKTELAKTAQKKYANYMSSSKISRYELEFALTEVQILLGCCYRFLETPQDIYDMIIQYTKSVTQAPQKLENRERYKDLEWYIPKDNRDCVQVDKNGNGLHRLWQQQLTMFESVRLETAEAIMSVYPTPASLFEAYRNCSESEGRKLLENLPIRRAAGPLTTLRKIGPQLSNKMYNFFNATDGDTVI